MAEHNLLGKNGENVAAEFLAGQGYAILHRNWRSGRKELDIVARKDGEIIVIEVKTRRDTDFALPQDAVSPLKIRRIVAATDVYLKKFRIDNPVRFDIITVVGSSTPFKIEHIENAFIPPVW